MFATLPNSLGGDDVLTNRRRGEKMAEKIKISEH
jgi:hypothetical protein